MKYWAVRCHAEEERWNAQKDLDFRHTSLQPNIEEMDKNLRIRVKMPIPDAAGDVRLALPNQGIVSPRRVYIRKHHLTELAEQIGLTLLCPGCDLVCRGGRGSANHTEACRQRL